MSLKSKNIKISPKLLEKAVKSSQERLYFFYCYLKSKQTSGTFKHLHSDIQAISKELKISEQTVRRLINSLEREGFAYWTTPGGKQMRSKGSFKLISMYKLGHKFGEYKNSNKTKRITLKCNYKNCKEVFLVWVLENSRKQQIFSIIEKLSILSSNKKLKDALKRMSEEELKAYLKERGLCGRDNMIALGESRLNIAQKKGLKSATSGSRWVKRLIHAKLIKGDNKRSIYHGSYHPIKFRELTREFGSKFYVFNGCIYERTINEIIFKDKKLNSVSGKGSRLSKKVLTDEQGLKGYNSKVMVVGLGV